MVKKEYSNDEVTVVWQPELCIHSGKCVQGLGKVFDPERKPWIDPTQATSGEIKAQVQKCPSGALSIKDSASASADSMSSVKVQLMPGGPMILKGTCEVVGEDGSIESRKNAAFCRCTKSKNFPYCDGSHKG
ncbi:MAG: hypothetical protein DHS20C17_06010 [Cyclobacteriaceae bacterium]|nr:MAG: hypothetical protein DHS20C17_06010 [Cyclobacteriaceae bacterium]